MVKTVTNIL